MLVCCVGDGASSLLDGVDAREEVDIDASDEGVDGRSTRLEAPAL
jgi:hypothetical protein